MTSEKRNLEMRTNENNEYWVWRHLTNSLLKPVSDWLATNTDVITSQSHSIFAWRENITKWKTDL
jgi:hypothetical protein